MRKRTRTLSPVAYALFCLIALVAATIAGQEPAPPEARGQADGTTDRTPLKVYICAGQSNMVGKRSQAEDLPEEMRAETAGILVYNAESGKWTPMHPPEKGFGPEVTFAHAMHAALGEPVGIIKHSRGGTSLSGPWHPETPGKLYAELREIVKAARETREIEVVGMIWMQGERDSRDEAAAALYGELLAKLITQARKDFAAPGMFFVAGRVNPPERYAHAPAVRKAQQECKAEAYAWVDCDKLSKGGDNLHFDTKGQVSLGQLFAEAMQRLAKEREEKEQEENVAE